MISLKLLWALCGTAVLVMNFVFLRNILEIDEEDYRNILEIDEEDYCSADSRVCLYHNICYDTVTESWQTATDSMKHFPILNAMNHTKHSDAREPFAACNERFEPKPNVSFPSRQEMTYREGTTYLVCCWVNHFGHNLIHMMVSSVHALVAIGLKNAFFANEITFLVDNRFDKKRGNPNIILHLFEFLTKNSDRVSSLEALTKQVKKTGKDKVCFEKLVVGMRHDDLVFGLGPEKEDGAHLRTALERKTAPGASMNMIQPIRDHLDKMYPLTRESSISAIKETEFLPANGDYKASPPVCTITFLQRKKTRVIGNFNDVLGIAKEVFHEPKWNIRSVAFEETSLESQYIIVRSSMVFITASGTGSHMGMFLNDGGINYEFMYAPLSKLANKYICDVSPYMSCTGTPSTCSESNCKHVKYTYVDLKAFRDKIMSVKEEISSKCVWVH